MTGTRRTPAQYNWDKVLFDETFLGLHYTSPRRDTFRFVVVHHMTIVGSGTGSALTACYNTWQTREASAHYGVDGALVRQFVRDGDAAWATASTYGNHAGISIEHANSASGPSWTVGDLTWKTGAKLAAYLHKAYGLGRPVKDVTLRRHHDFYATACPGPYIDSIWSKYAAEAQRVYDAIGASTPAPTPAPAPEPVDTIKLEVLLLPTAGYNASTAKGVTAWKANTKGLAALVNQHTPDLVGTTELSNRSIDPMRPLFDSLVTAYAREPGGSDGRYIYRRKSTTNHIASGHVNVSNASELNDDDKQAAWSVIEFGGVRKGIIAMHTENEDGIDQTSGINADDLRVDQTFSALGRALTAMAPYGITADDVIYVGDFNSESQVKNAMVAKGWKAIGPGWFTRWDDSAKTPCDWGFIKAGSATFERINHAFSDHTALRIVWTTPK